eukprot:17845-Heterococcus_DN1.PRE.1
MSLQQTIAHVTAQSLVCRISMCSERVPLSLTSVPVHYDGSHCCCAAVITYSRSFAVWLCSIFMCKTHHGEELLRTYCRTKERSPHAPHALQYDSYLAVSVHCVLFSVVDADHMLTQRVRTYVYTLIYRHVLLYEQSDNKHYKSSI